MSVLIPDQILKASRLSEAEMRLEIAALLFGKEKLTLAQASQFAQLPLLRFSHFLASRSHEVHDGTEERTEDLLTLSDLDLH